MRQFFVQRKMNPSEKGLAFERKLYIVRRLSTYKLGIMRKMKMIRLLHQFII